MKIRFMLILFFVLLLPVVEAGRLDQFKEIAHEKPKYIRRKSDAWREGGRVIGEVKHVPDNFTIKLTHVGTTKVFYTYKSPARLSIYQTKRLSPGTYDMTIESEGFLPYLIKNVKILARRDCIINITFGRKVYDNR
jgi:hypothetical protein